MLIRKGARSNRRALGAPFHLLDSESFLANSAVDTHDVRHLLWADLAFNSLSRY